MSPDTPQSNIDLCKRCDVFIGYGGVGVVAMPMKSSEWLKSHCWMCGRSREEILTMQAPAPTRLIDPRH